VNAVTNSIEVNPKPGINAGPDKVVLQGGSVTLTPSQNIGMTVSYLWSPSTGLDDPTVSNPSASPQDDITYTLTVTSDKGCQTSDQVFVKVLKAVIIPNIFSPNGDNVHDRWEIPYLESYPGCTIDIYNRYGQLVYHSVGYAKPWDGKVNGKDVPVGTYYYVIDPKNGRTRLSGYVDVIR
jgi:gliding motility-associated-like protein